MKKDEIHKKRQTACKLNLPGVKSILQLSNYDTWNKNSEK